METIDTKFILSCAFAALAAYLLGSLNFAIIISKFYYKDDIRNHGTGNAGMTNILRTFGIKPAVFTIAGDFTKALAAAGIGVYVFNRFGVTLFSGGYIGFVFVLLGHLFPLYFGFKGGKGIASAVGAIVVINPTIAGILIVIFVIVVGFSRIFSLASIVCALFYAPIVWRVYSIRGENPVGNTVIAACIAAVVLFMHRSNIKRLLAGTEKKMVLPKK